MAISLPFSTEKDEEASDDFFVWWAAEELGASLDYARSSVVIFIKGPFAFFNEVVLSKKVAFDLPFEQVRNCEVRLFGNDGFPDSITARPVGVDVMCAVLGNGSADFKELWLFSRIPQIEFKPNLVGGQGHH